MGLIWETFGRHRALEDLFFVSEEEMQLYGLLRGDMESISSRPRSTAGVLVVPLFWFDCFHVLLISVEKSP